MRLRFLPVIGVSLAAFLVGGTALAAYRTAMGPLQCCASHCRHDEKLADDAQRCCASHLGALQKAAKKDSGPALDSPAMATPRVPHDGPAGIVGPVPPTADDRTIRSRSLFAQHTALLR